ncbi:hypothetical protein ABPG74_006583 [Tetrahymena malaccensis]
MNIEKIFPINSLILFILDGLNILISILLLMSGFQIYFISFWVLYAFEKLVLIVLKFSKYGQQINMWILLLDIIQLDLLSYKFKNYLFSVQGALLYKLFGRVYPQLMLQLIFFFGLDIFSNKKISNELIVLIYISFILWSIYAGALCRISSKACKSLSYKEILLSIVNHLSYYISLGQILLVQDRQNGVNGGVYYLLVILLNVIYILVKLEKDYSYKELNVFYLIMGVLMNYQFLLDSDLQQMEMQKQSEIQSPVFLSYFNQLARLGMVIGLSYYQISLGYSQTNNIFLLNLILSIILSVAFLFTFYPKLVSVIFDWKWVKINTESNLKDFIKCSQNQNNDKLKYLAIYICQKRWIKCKNPKPNQIQNAQNMPKDMRSILNIESTKLSQENIENQQDDHECLYYEFSNQLTELLKRKVIISYEDRYENTFCDCKKVMNLLIEQPYILNCMTKLAKDRYHVQLPEIINERIQKGYLFTPATTQLIQNAYPKKSKVEFEYLSNLKTLSLSLILYSNQIKNYMVINPQLIILDLYY